MDNEWLSLYLPTYFINTYNRQMVVTLYVYKNTRTTRCYTQLRTVNLIEYKSLLTGSIISSTLIFDIFNLNISLYK